MSVFGSLILTATSVAPVVLVYAIMAFLERCYAPAAILLAVGLMAFTAGPLLLSWARKRMEKHDITIGSVEAADRESIGLLILYVLPLLRTSFLDLDLLVLVPAGVIFLTLALTGHSFHFNPLLNILGWHFYKVSTPEGVTYVLVTKAHFHNTQDKVTVSQLTRYTLIQTGG